MGCDGCKSEHIIRSNSLALKQEEAKKFCNDNQITMVVYFDGMDWQMAEESVARQNGYPNIRAVYVP